MVADFIKTMQRYCCGSKVLVALILTNVLLFVAVWIVILIGSLAGLKGNFTMPWLCVSSAPLLALQRPWTFLTYMVTQYDFFHLLFNVLWLYWFGIYIPIHVSETRKLWLYIGGGLAGVAFYLGANILAISPHSGGYLCGASAAVLAIMTAVAFWTPRREISLFLLGAVQLRWVVAVCVALTFIGFNGGSVAAQAAHAGGVIFGAVFSLVHTRSRHNGRQHRTTPSETPALRKSRKIIRVNVHRDGRAVAEAATRLSDAGRLDRLLDKIRISGYNSLSAGERNELNLLSQRLDKNSKK